MNYTTTETIHCLQANKITTSSKGNDAITTCNKDEDCVVVYGTELSNNYYKCNKYENRRISAYISFVKGIYCN